MKQVLFVFLCIMISFGQAREDLLLQEDGTPASHQEPRQLKAPGILGNAETDKYAQAVPKYPYIDEKCCNLSTTYRCSDMGTEGFRGHCMPRNETCLGRELFGTKYCVISKHQSCKCCVPTDCKKQTLPPCAKLNGTCIGIKDHCIGTSIVSDEFCKKDSRNDTCKCCFPLVPLGDCPCGQDHDGICRGTYPVGHGSGGKEGKGRCMKTCGRGNTPLIDNTCNTTGGEDCKCCDLDNYCGETCESPHPTSCMCSLNAKGCPKGYCSHPDGDICPHGGCTCCKDKPTECVSKLDQCSSHKDYCVDKLNGNNCPSGFSKVYDACAEGTDGSQSRDRKGSKQDASKAKDCDCCKSTECSEGCFRIGSQCFMMPRYSTGEWEKATKYCAKYTQHLAEPQDPQALSQYLATNYPADSTSWIGARGTSNINAAWVSGGVIGPNAPWFGNWYATCNNPNWCMYLQANAGCYISNQCLGCWPCNKDTKRTILCSCDKSLYEH